MRIDTAGRPVALFLFAHQDDEFGVFAAIEHELRLQRRVVCVYMTDGGFGGVAPARRNAESLDVLGRLGVDSADIHFLGEAAAIANTQLYRAMLTGWHTLIERIAALGAIAALYVPAWEGGHPDHDAACAIGVLLRERLQLGDAARQFSLYNGCGLVGPLFWTLKPLPQNGAIDRYRIGWGDRIRFLLLCLRYRSQRKTWVGLFPFVLLNYAMIGRQQLQPLPVQRPDRRPHPGALYYERRNFLTWEVFHEHLQLFYRQVPVQSTETPL